MSNIIATVIQKGTAIKGEITAGNITMGTSLPEGGEVGQVLTKGENGAIWANAPTAQPETDPTVPEWAKQPEKPEYTAEEVGAVAEPKEGEVGQVLAKGENGIVWADMPTIETQPETDPTVPEWAKQPEKPEYTAEEVGAVANVDGGVKGTLAIGGASATNVRTDSHVLMQRLYSADEVRLSVQLKRRTGTVSGGYPKFEVIQLMIGEKNIVLPQPIAFESTNAATATRASLDVYSKGEVDSKESALTGTVNSLRNSVNTIQKDYALKTEIPDVSTFITRLVDDLANYYSKAETYTRSEIDQKVSAIPKFEILVVDSLPVVGANSTTVYLLRDGIDGNLYTEYIYVNGDWEILGSQRLDLAGYATEEWVGDQLSGYQPKGDYALRSELPTVPKKLSELADDSTHRLTTDAEKAAWNSKSNFSGAYADLTGAPTIPTVPTKISAFENDAGFLTRHQDISGKLDADKLPEAIDTALAQAKASGEFDGKDGDDGFSPTVATSKDGKVTTITIADKDGPKTATIHDGVDGYTPVKGKDYSDGLNGVSPTVSVATITGGHRITIEDTNGKKTVDVLDGAKGDAGRGITSVTRTSGNGAAGTTDTYTITYTDGSTTTFGVYNGKNGTNGTSVTVSEVTESNVDGGSNVVRFSDGNTVTIKNGSKGSPGSDATVTAASVKSALGYTPASQTAVNQLAEEITAIGTRAEIVQAVIAALPVYNGEVV